MTTNRRGEGGIKIENKTKQKKHGIKYQCVTERTNISKHSLYCIASNKAMSFSFILPFHLNQ